MSTSHDNAIREIQQQIDDIAVAQQAIARNELREIIELMKTIPDTALEVRQLSHRFDQMELGAVHQISPSSLDLLTIIR